MLYALLGQLVDWLADKNPQDFIEEQWLSLLAMSLFVLVFIPVVVVFHSLVVHQTLMGNFPMQVRWKSHRYLIGQSYSFFQNEFSGRIATKVMQTALAVRECVMKLLDVLLFVSVYLVTTFLLVMNSDFRLSLPLLAWLLAYLCLLRFFVPKLRDISTLQADARSDMTGRVVDSYTNIQTLKLFSHARRETEYARKGMQGFLDTVHPQMRLVTCFDISVWVLNMLLVFSVGALGISLWMQDAISPGAIAMAFSLAIRYTGQARCRKVDS
jgi:ATP-binding cassette subfamily B protein/ATP-binding cassette subfamily B multidrug efflux pump